MYPKKATYTKNTKNQKKKEKNSPMDFLKAEINRKRKAIDDIRSQTGSNEKIGSSRFIKQKDLQTALEQQKMEAQRKLDEERAQRTRAATKIQDDAHDQNKKRGASLPNDENTESNARTDLSHLSMTEIKHRLRMLMQPVTLFGESNEERISRLVAKMGDTQQEEDDYRLDASSGHR